MRSFRFTSLLLLTVLFVLGGSMASAEDKTGEPGDHLALAHEHLVNLLAKAPEKKINFVVENYDQAQMLLDLCADTYFDKGLKSLGGADKAGLLAASVIDAWKDHEVRWEEKTFFASEAFEVRSALGAERLGGLLYAVASIIVRLEEEGTHTLSARGTAGRIFAAVVPEAGENARILDQYYVQIMELSMKPLADLRGFAVALRR